MQCWQCGAAVRPGAKLCVYCGANLALDAADADASMNRRSSSGARPSRDGSPGPRARWDGEPEDDGARGSDRRSYGRGSAPHDDDRAHEYRRRGGDDYDRAARDVTRRPGRDQRDPLDDPRAPRSVRSMPNRDANPSRRDSRDERFDRWGADERQPERDDRYPERRDNRSRPDRYAEPERWDGRDRSRGERYPDRGQGGWNQAYPDDSQEYSAEYDAQYSAEYPAPAWRDESAEYGQQRPYARENAFDERSGRGWQEPDRGRSARGTHDAPLEDSWGMPAATGWTDESVRIPASPARKGAQRGKGKRAGSVDQAIGKKRRAPMLIGVALVVVALIGAGFYLYPNIQRRLSGVSAGSCASSNVTKTAVASGTPVAAATPPTNYKLYTDTQTGYVMPYPTSWSATSGTDTSQAQTDAVTRFSESSPNAVFTVEHTPTFDCASNTEIIDNEVLGGKQAGETFTELASAAGTQSLGGEQCLRKEYSVTTQNKSNLHMAIIACHHAGKGYAFIIYSDATAFDQVNSGAFKTMLANFRFTS